MQEIILQQIDTKRGQHRSTKFHQISWAYFNQTNTHYSAALLFFSKKFQQHCYLSWGRWLIWGQIPLIAVIPQATAATSAIASASRRRCANAMATTLFRDAVSHAIPACAAVGAMRYPTVVVAGSPRRWECGYRLGFELVSGIGEWGKQWPYNAFTQMPGCFLRKNTALADVASDLVGTRVFLYQIVKAL
jgi:hypothetical protein